MWYPEPMNTVDEKIEHVLSTTEEQLLLLIRDAATEGDLNGVDRAREMAGSVRSLQERLSRIRTEPAQIASVPATAEAPQSLPSGEYPRFSIEGGALVRVGWSKKAQSEYQQRIPRAQFDAVIDVLGALTRADVNGEAISSDSIWAELQESAPPYIPNYQMYAVFGLLKQEGCAEQFGRAGYRFPRDIVQQAAAAWGRLARSSAGQ